MQFSDLTRRVAGEGADAWNIHYRALARKAAGDDVIVLSVGDPDFDTPSDTVETAVKSLRGGATHYADIKGKRRLREIIAGQQSEAGGQEVTPDNVAVVAGAQCALFAVAQCVLDAGDEVIAPEPMYVTYEAAMRATGAELVRIPLRAENDFALDVADIAAAITPKTRALLLNTPHNPTGRMLGREQWEAIAELCRKHDLWVISDEVYAPLTFGQQHVHPGSLPGMAERTASLGSLSKSHAMTGWRLGWIVGPKALIEHVNHVLLCMLYGIPEFIQDAACTALTSSTGATLRMRDAYRERSKVVCEELARSEILNTVQPDAGMFVMVDVRATGLSAQEFADRLLDEQGVSALVGEAFGPSGAGFIRLGLTVETAQLREACRRIELCARQCLAGAADAV